MCEMYDHLEKNFTAVEHEIEATCKRAGRNVSDITLITVTKTYPVDLAQAVIDTDHLDIGENRPQEIMDKMPVLTGEPTMHLIGQLQTNKVRKMIPLVKWIHSVDREKLLDKIDTIAEELQTPVNILIQVNTSGEASKSGCSPEEAITLCQKAATKEWARFCGLMTIGPLHGDDTDVRKSFQQLRAIGEEVKELVKGEKLELSMGMSGDFPLAIEEGATMIRVGSRIVGARSYT